jgi:hypothetical protein
MKMTRLGIIAAVCLAVPTLVWADAVNLSHLQCFKFKDTLPKAKYRADEIGSPGCVIKVPAIMVCNYTYKINVTPPPPTTGPDVTLNHSIFFCYKQKCPKLPISGTFTDQFGTHVVDTPITSAKMLCAPASPSGALLDDSGF